MNTFKVTKVSSSRHKITYETQKLKKTERKSNKDLAENFTSTEHATVPH